MESRRYSRVDFKIALFRRNGPLLEFLNYQTPVISGICVNSMWSSLYPQLKRLSVWESIQYQIESGHRPRAHVVTWGDSAARSVFEGKHATVMGSAVPVIHVSRRVPHWFHHRHRRVFGLGTVPKLRNVHVSARSCIAFSGVREFSRFVSVGSPRTPRCRCHDSGCQFVNSGPVTGILPWLADFPSLRTSNPPGPQHRFQVISSAIPMGKKKLSNAQTSKAAAKAAKKAKAAQKTERKEKKKSGKAKDEFDDDQDLEAILENVSKHSAFASRGLSNKGTCQ